MEGTKPLDDDYISPDLEVVSLDAAFPNMIVGTKSSNMWPYLRREIGHHWYVDRRNPTVGFLSRDEAMLLFNIARRHFGKPCLEIGCWRGWSTAHMALGAGNLEVIDPVLADPEFREDVAQSLQRAGVGSSVVLHVGSSPDMVTQLSEETGKRWSLVFIDGDHEGDAPRRDAEVVHRYAGEDAAILLHDLTSPHVATALAWLRDHGWTTAIYQTMQIMGIAVRGVVKPVAHLPDPRQRWTLPRHLTSFPVMGETLGLRLRRIVTDLEWQRPEPGREVANSGLDVLSDVDAKALDALLVWAADSLEGRHETATAFDELQARYLRLLDRLATREAEPDLSQEFARLQAKHLQALARAADLEYQLGAAQSESEAVAERLRQEREVTRDLVVERNLLTKMLDRVQQKHLEVLGRQAGCRQADVQAQSTRRVSEAAALTALAAEHSVELRVAIDRFASWMARKRILLGLSRRLLVGRTKEVQQLIEHNLRVSGVPDSLIPAAIWLARVRVVLGLARRCALTDIVSVQGHLVLSLERSFDISWVGTHNAMAQGAAAAAFNRLRDQVGELENQLRTAQKRFAALEAAKLADEKALLEADLTIVRLRKPQEAQSSR